MAAAPALNLPEILAAVLEHLHPDDAFYILKRGPQIACHHRISSDGLAALNAAARVNRLWFHVAVPILWQRPLEDALSNDSVADPARRDFYAKHIREVHLSRRSALWRALAFPRTSTAAAGDPGNDAANAGNVPRPPPSSGTVADRLRLPKLVTLHISSTWNSGEDFRGALRDQAPLLWMVGPSLRKLSCHLAPELLDRLEALQQQLLRNDDAAAADAAAPPVPQRYMQLRDLSLIGFRVHYGGVDVRSHERLLAWLAKCQRVAPRLARLKLHAVMPIDAARLALHHMGQLGTLNDLFVYAHDNDDDDPQGAGFVGRDILGHSPACGPDFCYCRMDICRPARGFEGVRRFQSALSVRALPSLLTLMPALRELSIVLLRDSANGAADNNNSNNGDNPRITPALEILATLSQLQTLCLVCQHILAPADIRLLHSLKQLQSLEIINGGESDVTDDDVVALLRALPHLHTLRYEGELPGLSDNALCVIGSASPLLRHITMPCYLSLPPDTVQQTPLFPSLEALEVLAADRHLDTIAR
jgi:hypothetical protein